MLVFENVRWRNFLSTGNAWNEIRLDAQSRTLIVGKNGNGKTTFLDAICYALYGKAFRNINKPNLINSTNQKGLLVEIQFSTQNNNYLVRRGMKPNIFEIICNGKPIPVLPSVVEMQDYLERYILKCNFKAFTQVVILGTASYVPFMRLTPQVRREVLENVLDVEIFGVMNSLLKARLSTTKDELNAAQSGYAIIESQHKLADSYAIEWEKNLEGKRLKIDGDIDVFDQELAQITLDEDTARKDYAKWDPIASQFTKLRDQHAKAARLSERFTTQIQQHRKSHEFFVNNDGCPTCTQIIEESFKQGKILEADQQATEIEAKRDEIFDILAEIEQKMAKSDAARIEVDKAKQQLNVLDIKRNSVLKQQAKLQAEKQSLTGSAPPVMQLGDLNAAKTAVDTLLIRKNSLEHAHTLLKDNGIRTRIVNQYLPIINKTVNKYLTALDFPIQFILDDQFNETIKSRGRDEFSYENFSEGEKRRIDLAIILTWRDIAKLKNSVATNILVFDEIFDSSLDSDGTDDFMRLLQKMDVGTNVFVISHKQDIVSDKFPQTLTVTKVRGFSEISKT